MSSSRFGLSRYVVAAAVAVGCAGSALLAPSDAYAQVAGTTNQPIPNVLLLVDTSGSMERMTDDRLPGDTTSPDPNTGCNPGQQSTPNRWGTLLQALTGTFQPYYSCDKLDRKSTRFSQEYQIGLKPPYDKNYDLPHHRPLTGATTNACANMPYKLAGGVGVGGANLGDSTVTPNAFLPDGVKSFLNSSVVSINGGSLSGATACTFSQANDGQLDAVQDFVRFGLMTFDSDPSLGQGVTSNPYSASFGSSVDTSGGIPAVSPPYARPFDGLWSYYRNYPTANTAVTGAPTGCPTLSPFEVGARHWAAPQWEGRHVPFANPVGTLADIETTNSQIQSVILSSRPWGATPIAGLLDDARDYLWYNDYGPNGTQPGYKDPYVQTGCRNQFIILLTDGEPNLDLRPNCTGANCPYLASWQIAQDLYNNTYTNIATGASSGASKQSVQTFVIGFSVNGSARTPNDGFPTTGLNGTYTPTSPITCAKWYADTGTNGGNNSAATMNTVCGTLGAAIPKGSTAAACCELNKIALYGSGGTTGAFFADSGVDIVTAFSRILGGIAKSATTRTSPGASPSMNLSTAGGNQTVSATYVASFIPNARKVWSGEIDRSRVTCATNSATPTSVPQKDTEGDFYSVDTATQALTNSRRFLTVVADPTGSSVTSTYPATGSSTSQPVIDSASTIRPFASATDGAPLYSGTEQFGLNTSLLSSIPNFPSALGIDNTTCKKSQYVTSVAPYTFTVPPLDATNCAEVIWDFTTAYAGSVLKTVGTNTFDFNLRCKSGPNAATAGTCSISGTGCTLDAPTCPISGEACVPFCSALGAVFRSTPTVAGPPSGFLRDEGFRGYQAARSNRRPVMYVATTDGLLHAFKALYDDPSQLAPSSANYELWSFIPPAVLPRLAANFPGGQQILLDGSPIVKDTVWYRTGATLQGTQNLNDWHTTLVASLGAGGAGYYALNVSDPDCGGLPAGSNPGAPNACNSGFVAATPGAANALTASAGGTSTGGRQPGPHFLWQITDIEKAASGEVNLKASRAAVPYSSGAKTFVPLFGKQTGTPVITTLNMKDNAGNPVQVGVAILPGGIDGPPAYPAADVLGKGMCPRAISTMGASYRVDNLDAGPGSQLPAGATGFTRQWAPNCTDAVAGRGVTIVRLDNGEIIRHFGRKTQDVPQRLAAYTIDSPFDSPMTGTPVVYPAALGAAAEKVFIGDADGTIWRIDLSDPCYVNPSAGACGWKAVLFADIPAQTGTSVKFKLPIAVPPIVSQSPTGSLVVNVATGDQENIVASTDVNYVMSLEETRPAGATRLKWFRSLTGGERVTGPMAVFDRTLYFASYAPASSLNVCAPTATAYLWGLDYFNQQTVGSPSAGGAYRWCKFSDAPILASSNVSGLCAGPFVDKETGADAIPTPISGIVPGVAVTPSLACTSTGSLSQDYGQGITGISPTTYSINFNWSTKGSAPGGTGAAVASRGGVRTATPRYNATLDAWALVTD